ncbi:outer membrane protein OmpU [Aliiroseovarius sediminilitoris]|uniref:Outer membrane protein OmpU n=1 Tax=Aliiroseovarius sediminilitoris TaxID=1173584 RepID=A0A1I0MNP3_9RHOB|nr:porin [Aliiroseovarius sediminilitoris]SEV90148.1 outer membrane protein OmpU [Aliiroseovarius sediminilitoris]
MKKILFASTALVASAGFAAAEISFSGEAGIGFEYADVAVGDDWTLDHYLTLTVSMTGETDGGLGFGATFDITNTAGGGAVDGSSAYIEGGFGKFSVGNVGSAVDAKLGLSDIGYGGIGTDNVAEALVDAADMGNMMYEGTFGDFGIAISHDFNGTEITSVAATYSMGDFNVGLGYDDWGNIDTSNTIHVKAGADIADFSINALYSRNDDNDVTSYGIHGAYTMGAVVVSAAYSEVEVGALSTDAYGLGVAYDLGGGASFNAGVGEVGGTTVADLGIIMLF